MYPSVKKVVPCEDYVLSIVFENGECGNLDMKKYPDFGIGSFAIDSKQEKWYFSLDLIGDKKIQKGVRMDRKKLKALIRENSGLFWWIKPEERENIELPFLVESVLSYGDEESVRELFQIVGTKTVAEIFRRQISGNRPNYHPRTMHFFKLYFDRHA